jgi:predicted alpha/beta-hydrolase family hydrolase
MEAGSRRPDVPTLCHATVRAAAAAAAGAIPDAPLIAGGKSFGGRMTSQAQAIHAIAGVRGLAFLGFPLHPEGKPSVTRAQHLEEVKIPMLFIQGANDKLADLALFKPIIANLGSLATLVTVPMADHSFHVQKRSGTSDSQVLDSLLDQFADWLLKC